MRQELGRIHTSVRDKPDLYSTEIRWCWDQHPFHAGAYAFFMPGEHYRFYEDLTRPEGRIFLAGEHASLTHSWIQGAFESAVRTMHTILTMESASLPA
jgi:monoamine oxidase